MYSAQKRSLRSAMLTKEIIRALIIIPVETSFGPVQSPRAGPFCVGSCPMSDARMTSTGHAVSDAPWLDLHFQTCRAEYEDAVHFVGIEPGWTVLDAGSGSGGYIPLLRELVGPTGQVTALDLAPENVT